jgi:hypothetical protein
MGVHGLLLDCLSKLLSLLKHTVSLLVCRHCCKADLVACPCKLLRLELAPVERRTKIFSQYFVVVPV